MTGLIPIHTKNAREILMESGAWPAIIRAAEEPTALGDVALTVRDVILETQVIDMTRPETAAMVQAALNALQQAGMITQETHEKLMALAQPSDGDANVPTVRLVKGHPVPRSGLVVLNTGDYKLNELVECARADAPNFSYGAFLASVIVEASP